VSRLLDDFRFAARTLRRNLGFTVAAVVALALGIGSCAAIFSVVNEVLLEPLPYPEPDRLVQLITVSQIGNQSAVSIPKYVIWRDHTSVFESIAAYDIGALSVNLSQGDFAEALTAARVSADYFTLFGAHAKIGRTFSADEDRYGGPRVAVISDSLWRGRFRGDPRLVGSIISIEQQPCKVIGVLAPGFGGSSFNGNRTTDVWLPLQADPSSADHVSRVRVTARLKPGIKLSDAQNDVGATMGPFLKKYRPQSASEAPLLFLEGFTAIPLRDAVVGDVRPALYLLTGAVGFVLLISCANVASLLLARASRRAREIAIRAALGAQRRQIIRGLLAESVVISLFGGGFGLALGYVGVRALLAIAPSDIPRVGANGSAIALDWRVFIFTLAISLVTAILSGLIPALSASRNDGSSLIRDNVWQSGMGFNRNRGRSALVTIEMALALVLLTGAGFLIRTFVAARTVNRGFDERNVLTLEMSVAGSQLQKTAQVAELVRRAERRIGRIPGVSAVAATCALPLEPSLTLPFTILKNDQSMVGRYHGAATWRSVSPGFFDVFRIRLLRGRLFNDEDNEQAAGVVLVNRAMLKKYWQEVDANPIGDFMAIGKSMGPGLEDAPRQIVGVVADVRDAGLDREPMMYVPIAQVPDGMNARNNRILPITWAIRAVPSSMAQGAMPTAAIQEELHRIGGGIPLGRVRTMHQVVAASAARTQFYTMLLTVFAGIALVLAAVGLYCLMAYSVQQRTPEIGIRMALGAGPGDVRSIVMLQGMRLALLGILLGIPAALGLARIAVSMIFGIRTWDPVVLAAVAALLTGVALLAAYVPSLRATRVNPADALRI
jgi:putative ABC transport system permease protein